MSKEQVDVPKGASRVVPPAWFVIFAVDMVLIWYWVPGAQLIEPPYTYLGAVIFGAGVVLAFYGKRQFDHVGTPVRPFTTSTSVVVSGPFRFSRNPMYLSMVIALIGIGVGLGKIAPFVMVPLFMIWMRSKFIKHEEDLMLERFGEEYLAYKRRVRRWI